VRDGGRVRRQIRHTPVEYCSDDYLADIGEQCLSRGWYWQAEYEDIEPNAEEQAEIEQERRKAAEAEEAHRRAAEESRRKRDAISEEAASLGLVSCDCGWYLERGRRPQWTELWRSDDRRASWARWTTPKGTIVYRYDVHWGDDYRCEYLLPPDAARWCLDQWVAESGITPQKALDWLLRYEGCVGTDSYLCAAGELAATKEWRDQRRKEINDARRAEARRRADEALAGLVEVAELPRAEGRLLWREIQGTGLRVAETGGSRIVYREARLDKDRNLVPGRYWASPGLVKEGAQEREEKDKRNMQIVEEEE
jgi:hypothetical protein